METIKQQKLSLETVLDETNTTKENIMSWFSKPLSQTSAFIMLKHLCLRGGIKKKSFPFTLCKILKMVLTSKIWIFTNDHYI